MESEHTPAHTLRREQSDKIQTELKGSGQLNIDFGAIGNAAVLFTL